MNWYIIPDYPDYHINDDGEARNAKGVMLSLRPDGHYLFVHHGRRVAVKKSDFQKLDLSSLEKAPDLVTVQRNKKSDSSKYNAQERALLKESGNSARAPKRGCTDCGKPTTSYRCEKCWRKKRGFGVEEVGENPEIANKEAYFEAVKAAKARKVKAPPPSSWLDGWKPLTWRPHIEDRQMEFLASQQSRQMRITEEKMPEETAEYQTTKELAAPESTAPRRTYTLPVLADLAGVKYASAVRIRNGPDQTGRNAQKLNELMQSLGITWADVKKIPHGERRQRNASQKEAEAHNLKKTMTEVARSMEPKAETLLQEPKNVDLEKFDGDVNKLIASLNGEPQKTKVPPAQSLSLEQMLSEIKQLLPRGAKVRIEF